MRPLFLLFALFLSIPGFADSFYLWQRNWNAAVVNAVEQEKQTNGFFHLAGEINSKNGKIVLEKIHPDRKTMAKIRSVPVFRIHTSALSLSNSKLAEILYDPTLDAMQLDLDCPENKLERYTGIVRELKKRYSPRIPISATVLPVHLKHKEFQTLISELDFYVLQVHGLEFGKHATLIRESVALPAIQKALELQKPFLTALPCYAYQLNYKNGKFISINAERVPEKDKNTQTILLEADYNVVLKCIGLLRKNRKRIVWFRFPVPGDRLCLDRESLQILMNGKIPEKKLECLWKKEKNGLSVLSIKNTATLGEREISVTLNLSSFSISDYGFFNGFTAGENHVFGIPPDSVKGLAPTPGTEKKIMWLRTNDNISTNCGSTYK